ncbi:MAG: hypothetical protein ACTSQ8_17445 [Candidatus Helarchaeota archaeon]
MKQKQNQIRKFLIRKVRISHGSNAVINILNTTSMKKALLKFLRGIDYVVVADIQNINVNLGAPVYLACDINGGNGYILDPKDVVVYVHNAKIVHNSRMIPFRITNERYSSSISNPRDLIDKLLIRGAGRLGGRMRILEIDENKYIAYPIIMDRDMKTARMQFRELLSLFKGRDDVFVICADEDDVEDVSTCGLPFSIKRYPRDRYRVIISTEKVSNLLLSGSKVKISISGYGHSSKIWISVSKCHKNNECNFCTNISSCVGDTLIGVEE